MRALPRFVPQCMLFVPSQFLRACFRYANIKMPVNSEMPLMHQHL